MEEKIKVVQNVLYDLGAAEKPIINVYNKIDLLDFVPQNDDKHIYISAKEKIGLDVLLKAIDDLVFTDVEIIEFNIPYKNISEYNYLKENAKIIEEKYGDKGIYIKAEVRPNIKYKLKDFIL